MSNKKKKTNNKKKNPRQFKNLGHKDFDWVLKNVIDKDDFTNAHFEYMSENFAAYIKKHRVFETLDGFMEKMAIAERYTDAENYPDWEELATIASDVEYKIRLASVYHEMLFDFKTECFDVNSYLPVSKRLSDKNVEAVLDMAAKRYLIGIIPTNHVGMHSDDGKELTLLGDEDEHVMTIRDKATKKTYITFVSKKLESAFSWFEENEPNSTFYKWLKTEIDIATQNIRDYGTTK